jgi:dipeptidyl aminopeptidase/acylaminoacyl peptidase
LRIRDLIVILLVLLLTACSAPISPATPTATASITPTEEPAATATASATPWPTATPDPYKPYTIAFLRGREYGGGDLEIVERVGANSAFTRYLIRYPSDGLMIHGFMNVPLGDGPHPVIIALHGYIDPSIYDTFDYTTLRRCIGQRRLPGGASQSGGYPPSDDGDNLFRVGMATDVLNLIAILKASAGQPGPLEAADASRIGMWGHSMGGGITTRVITVSPDIKAAGLYAAMSGDECRTYVAIGAGSDMASGVEERAVPIEQLALISPVHFFGDITAAVSIHHGLADELVPVQWSMQTCELLKAGGKNVECHFYEDMPHTFRGQGDKEFIQYTIQFMNRNLPAP